jgi:cobalamin biosynthesis Mg chelatase CobN
MQKNIRNNGIKTVLLVAALLMLALPVYAQSESYAQTTSNETGYFEITGLEPGHYNLDANVSAANNPSPFDLFGQVEFELMPGEGRKDLFVVMGISANRSASNVGNVTSEEGKVCGYLQSFNPFTHTWSPISNGEIRVEKITEGDDLPPADAPVMPAPNATTDTNGNFTFTGLPAGNYTITALRESPYGIGIGNITITIEAGQHLIDLEIWLNGSTSSDLANATKNTTFVSSGNSYGTGSISGRVLMCIPPGSSNVQPVSSASVIITEYTGEGNLGSVNKDPKIVFLLLSEADILLTKQAAEHCGLNISVYCNYRIPPDLDLTIYDFVFVERLVTESLQDQILPMVEEAKEHNVSVVLTSPSTELGSVNLTKHPYILEYWSNRCPKNMEQLLIYVGVNFCGLDGVFEEPATIVQEGIYHPDADHIFENLTEYLAWYENDTGSNHTYNPDNYTVGVTFWRERYLTGEIEIEDEIIRTLEERGINVIAAFQPMVLYPPLYPPNSPCVNTTRIFMQDGEPAVDAVIDLGFGVYLIMAMVKNTDCLEMLDVPIINGIELYTTIDEWRNGTTGSDFYFPYHIPIMEIAGQIESIAVGGTEYNSVYDVFLLKPIDSQIDWIVDRTVSWIDLGYENNSEKNVAIIYYHHSVGKDSCLVAANLDVAPSIVNLLHAMNGSGYTLGEDIPDDEELLDLVLTQGRNIGIWVQEEINYVAENHDVALVSEEDYLEWFEELPEKKQDEVTERWGPPPGDIMVYKNDSGKFLVIPKITLGNTIVAPQPSRAAEQNMTALYHDKSIPPTHQYIAFYYWLNHVYEADAIVSVGRHGTQEWLPGKGVGLSIDDCWPAILIQEMPVVYHYEVEGIGEGIMAKRRGNAVMIDHLTPVIVAAGLYGNLSNLEQTIPLYEREENGTLKMKYREQIIEMCRDLNLDQDLGIDLNETATANETVFEEFLEEIHDYLLEIKREYMPYGLHIMGKQVSDDGLVDMTKSLLGYRFREYVERMNISENQTRILIEEVIINGTSPEDTQKMILGVSNNVTEDASENMTVLERTTTDSNGNYTFSNLAAGNYTITAVKLSPVGWSIGIVNVSVAESEVAEADAIWLGLTEWEAVEDILNATIDSGDLTGVSSISGRVLAETPFGTFPGDDATVVITEQDSGDGVVADELTDYLNLAVVYADNLRECVIEIDRTLDALEGKYITPGPSNDPIRNPDVLPTGRNFYGFDPNIVPTKPAWDVGKETIDQLLAQYYNENGAYPEKIGFVMFSFNTMKDLGVLESEIFYLMGVEPVWDVNGNVKDVRLIPSEELERPRIDVVVTMSGIYRENWPYQIELINKAVRIASESDDSPPYRNYVNESTESTYQWLIENNYTESLAHDLSLVRIFGPPDGVWGVGGFITAIESSGSWEDESKLADLYLRNMGYIYSDGIWGEQYVDLFSQNLNGTEVAIFAWSSHSHSVLGIDHTFEFFGGLSMAIRSITGEAPDMYINNLKDPGGAKLETLSQVITRDLRSMYYNPYWIEGMMEHDYAGAREMATIMANLWGWEVTSPDTITDAMWSEMYEVYVQDRYEMGLEGWFNENNPWARQSIMARMIEAIRKGYWNPSDEVKETLADEYQRSVEEYGVTCCGHTCGNPFLDDYVSGMLPALTTDPPEQPDSSDNNGEGTYPPTPTPKPPAPESTTNETQAEDISAIPGGVEEIPVVEEPEEVVGQVIEKTEMKTDITFSGMEVLGLVTVLLVLGLIYAGFRYKKR